jgi:hypothetical protein
LIEWQDWNDGTINASAALAVGAIQDQAVTFWFIVKCTSAAQDDVVGPDDGFVRVYYRITSGAIQLLYEATGVAPYLNWHSGVPTRLNKIESWNIGYSGILGDNYEVLISDDDEPPAEAPASCSGGVVPSVIDPPGGVEFEGLWPHRDRIFIELDLN